MALIKGKQDEVKKEQPKERQKRSWVAARRWSWGLFAAFWCLTPLWYPIPFMVALLRWAFPGLSFLVAFTVGSVVAATQYTVVAKWGPDIMKEIYTEAIHYARVQLKRIRWAKVAEESGLVQALKSSGQIKACRLLDWRGVRTELMQLGRADYRNARGHLVQEVTIEPRGRHFGSAALDACGAALCNILDFANHEVEQVQRKTAWWLPWARQNVLVYHLSRLVIPDSVPLPVPLFSSLIQNDPEATPLGETFVGGILRWRFADKIHLAIFGEQGGGKGNLLRTIITDTVIRGMYLTIVNPKTTGEFEWVTVIPGVHYIRANATTDPDSIYRVRDMLASAVAEAERRGVLFEDRGVSKLDQFNAHPDVAVNAQLKRWRIVLDEIRELLMPHPTDTEAVAGCRRECETLLNTLVSLGRAAGISVIVVTQNGRSDAFGKAGTTTRDNFAFIALASKNTQLHMLFQSITDKDKDIMASGRPGLAFTESADPKDFNGTGQLAQLWYGEHADVLPQLDGLVEEFGPLMPDAEALAVDAVEWLQSQQAIDEPADDGVIPITGALVPVKEVRKGEPPMPPPATTDEPAVGFWDRAPGDVAAERNNKGAA